MSKYSFSMIDVPGGSYGTEITAVFDNGTVAGESWRSYYAAYFTETPGGVAVDWSTSNGMVDLGQGLYGIPTLINQSGERAGATYNAVDGRQHLYTIVNGTVTLTDVPMYPTALSGGGYITGYVPDGTQGSLYTPQGQLVMFSIPGATFVSDMGVSSNGTVVGTFNDATGRHEFERTLDGTVKRFDVPHPLLPGATSDYVTLTGVNAAGTMVGSFSDGLRQHGFLIDPKGQIQEIDVPKAADTYVQAISDTGELGGWFDTQPYNGTHGFIADVTPAHATLAPGLSLDSDNTHMIGKIQFLTS